MEPGPDGRILQEGSDQTLRYPKAPGFAICSDEDYEVALCCLVFLRALRLTSDFFLASNHAHAGKMDDVVLFYRLKEDQSLKYRAILLQAKHTDKTKDKEPLYLLKLKEQFAMFLNVRNLWKQLVNVQSQLIELREISLVLYTNGGGGVSENARDVTTSADVKHLVEMLNTGGRILRISNAQRGPETSDFIGHLTHFTKQMRLDTADEFLGKEIFNVLSLTSLYVAEKLIFWLKNVVTRWWNEEGEGRYFTAQSVEWKKVLDKQIRRLNTATLIDEAQMNLGFTDEALQEVQTINGRKQVWISVRDKYHATVTRIRLLNALRVCLVLDVNFILSRLREIETLWMTFFCPTLVIDLSKDSPVEHSDLIQRLQTVVRSHAYKSLVVIAKEKPTQTGWFVLEAEETWSILGPVTRERLLSAKIIFQGKVVTLRDVGLPTTYVMSDKDVLSLCDPEGGPVIFGVSLPEPQVYYVSRCLQRITLNKLHLDTLKNTDTLIFPKGSYKNICRYRIMHRSDIVIKDNIGGTVFAAEWFDSDIRDLCCRFSVRGIRGFVGLEGLESRATEFIPLTWICEEPVLIIEGVSGVGKTSFVTAMSSMAKKRFNAYWVLKVDMSKHREFINKSNFRSESDGKTFLMQSLGNSQNCLERVVLEHSLSITGNLFLFLDAFDMVSPDFIAKCCELLKVIATKVKYRQMVVTTRPCTSKALEEALGTKVFKLPGFDEHEQRLFLKQFCTDKTKKVDEERISSLSQTSGSNLKIPLLCRMAAEVLLRGDQQSFLKYENPWRKVMLYQFYVEQRINDRLLVNLRLKVIRSGEIKLLETRVKEHLDNLETLAVQKVMTAKEIFSLKILSRLPNEKLGLVVKDGKSIDFEHETFGEYFLGRWLARHWLHCPRHLLRDILSRDGNELIVAALSWSLFESFPLLEAVALGDAEAVRRLQGGGGPSALHVAAMTQGRQQQQRQVWELLVAAGQDPLQEDDVFLSSALTLAVMFKNWHFVEVMLGKMKTLEGLTIFTDQNAARKVLPEIIRQDLIRLFQLILRLHEVILLNEFKQEVDGDGNTFLHVAVANNSISFMKLLIELKHVVNIQNYYGDSPLYISLRNGHKDAVRLLLDHGADINEKDMKGCSALMLAAGQGHLEIARLFIRKGADPNSKDKGGKTALMRAAGRGHLEIVSLLLENGADLSAKDEDGNTALVGAASEGLLEIVKLLLGKGADSNPMDESGKTLLVSVSGRGHREVLEVLMDNGADPNSKDKDGKTPLLVAATAGHQEIVKLLIGKGADPNPKDKDGQTGLMGAAAEGHLEIVNLLLGMGADPNSKNKDGTTALIRAAEQGHLEIVKVLVSKGASSNVENRYGKTVLIAAAERSHVAVVKLLVKNGAVPDLRNREGRTALMTAASEGHLEVVRLLLENGADPRIEDKEGKRALARATHEVLGLLVDTTSDPSIYTIYKFVVVLCIYCLVTVIFWLT